MKVHEYRLKELFRSRGLPVPPGSMIASAAEAEAVIDELGPPLAVKAQILAGGRGKAGGIRLVSTANEAREAVAALLGSRLITPQTGPRGLPVKQLLLERGCRISEEYYLALTMDRHQAAFLLVAGRAGGTEIEAVAAAAPDQLLKLVVDPDLGLRDYHFRTVSSELGIPRQSRAEFKKILEQLFGFALRHDCLLVEINPLALTAEGGLLIVDAKAEIDDNGLFRQPELRDPAAGQFDDPLEVQAAEIGLSYVRLEGEVGVMVNGAGLAMATLDLIEQAGGKAANFLDVGGGADSGKIAQGVDLLLRDPRVRILFINIFGGILRCDVLAEGLIRSAGRLSRQVPLVVRLAGTNADQGRILLHRSELAFLAAADLVEAMALLRDELSRSDS